MNIDTNKIAHLRDVLMKHAKKHGSIVSYGPKPPGCASRCGRTCIGSCYGVGLINTGVFTNE